MAPRGMSCGSANMSITLTIYQGHKLGQHLLLGSDGEEDTNSGCNSAADFDTTTGPVATEGSSA